MLRTAWVVPVSRPALKLAHNSLPPSQEFLGDTRRRARRAVFKVASTEPTAAYHLLVCFMPQGMLPAHPITQGSWGGSACWPLSLSGQSRLSPPSLNKNWITGDQGALESQTKALGPHLQLTPCRSTPLLFSTQPSGSGHSPLHPGKQKEKRNVGHSPHLCLWSWPGGPWGCPHHRAEGHRWLLPHFQLLSLMVGTWQS